MVRDKPKFHHHTEHTSVPAANRKYHLPCDKGGDPPSGTLEGRQDEFRELADSFDVMAHTARSARRRTDRRACARCSRPNDRRWAFLRSMNLRDAGFVLSGARLAGRPFSEAGSSEPSVRSAIL